MEKLSGCFTTKVIITFSEYFWSTKINYMMCSFFIFVFSFIIFFAKILFVFNTGIDFFPGLLVIFCLCLYTGKTNKGVITYTVHAFNTWILKIGITQKNLISFACLMFVDVKSCQYKMSWTYQYLQSIFRFSLLLGKSIFRSVNFEKYKS